MKSIQRVTQHSVPVKGIGATLPGNVNHRKFRALRLPQEARRTAPTPRFSVLRLGAATAAPCSRKGVLRERSRCAIFVAPSMIERDRSLASCIDGVLRQVTGGPLVKYLDRRCTPSAALTATFLRNAALQRAALLEERFSAGDVVLLIMPPGPEFLLSLLGCLYAGIIAIPLPEPDLHAHRERVGVVYADSAAAAVLCMSDNYRAVVQHFAEAGITPRLLALDDQAAQAASARIPNGVPLACGLHRPPADTVIVQYTSGSIRHPKGVALSSANVLANASLVQQRWGLSADSDVLVNWLPHHHDMGLMGGLLYPLLMGGRSVQMPPLAFVQHPVRWLRAIAEHRGTVSGGPAFAYGLCLDMIPEAQLAALDLSCWRVAFCGAEPVPAGLLQRFRDRLAPAGLDPSAVHACYGLAEATLFVAGERSLAGALALPPVPGALEPCRLSAQCRSALRIVDPETGTPLEDGLRGEIWVTGAFVAHGYTSELSGTDGENESDEDEFAATLPGDPARYLRTGDLGWIGPDGLYVSGRIKDTLIANGINVAASDLEWLAATCHPSLNPHAAAAVVTNTSQGREEVELVIEAKPSSAPIPDPVALAERIRRMVRTTYGIDLRAVRFVKRSTLERTTSGKIRRQAVAARLRTGYAYPEASA